MKLNAFPKEFLVFRQDRVICNGGGVLIAVSDSLKSSHVYSNFFGTCECIFVDVEMSGSTAIRIGSIFSQTNASADDYLCLFNCIVNQLENIKHFIAYGDFNLNIIGWSNLTASSNVYKAFLDTWIYSVCGFSH